MLVLSTAILLAPLTGQDSHHAAQPPAHPDTVGAEPSARIVPPPAGYRYPNGQTYVFDVEWHLFNAGTATVHMEQAGAQQKVTATAESAGVVNSLFKVRDQFVATFDPKTFCSTDVMKHIEEGSRKRDTDVTFDYTRRKSVFKENNLKTGEHRNIESDIPSCVTDVVSGFYYISSLPLIPGSVHTFPMGDNAKTAVVSSRVEGREQVKVPAGTFQTVRIRAEAISGSLVGKGTIWVWFTDDANRTPVQMKSKLGWGSLTFRLQRLERR